MHFLFPRQQLSFCQNDVTCLRPIYNAEATELSGGLLVKQRGAYPDFTLVRSEFQKSCDLWPRVYTVFPTNRRSVAARGGCCTYSCSVKKSDLHAECCCVHLGGLLGTQPLGRAPVHPCSAQMQRPARIPHLKAIKNHGIRRTRVTAASEITVDAFTTAI